MEYFKKILKRYALRYRRFGLLNVFFNVLYAVFGALSFLALFPMLEILFGKTEPLLAKPVFQGITEVKDYALDYLNYFVSVEMNGNLMQALSYTIGLIVILFLLKNLSGYLALYWLTFLRNGVLRDIRNDLYDKIVALPISYFSEKRKGDTISRVISDVQLIQNSYVSILEMIIKEPLSIIITLFMMIAISWKLTVFVFIFIPISAFIISKIGRSLKRQSIEVQDEQGNILSNLEETLGGLKVIKAYTAAPAFAEKFRASTRRFTHLSNGLLNRTNLASPTSEFLGIAMFAVMLWFGGRLVLIDGTLEGSLFITYMGLAYNILTPAKAISKALYNVRNGDGAASRVLQVLETESPIVEKEDAVMISAFAKAIEFKNIQFGYDPQLPVIHDLSFSIPAGSTVALVGQSGSGKSTMASLLPRFYDVQQGQILIDGQDIRDLTIKSLRSQMGLVTQESILFNASVRENLTMGFDGYTDEQIIESLKVANAWEFVKNLPDGLTTNIGDGGGKLSGGQRQRLSIARAVLKNPPILILDEATSALDTESERLVQDALENVMRDRTSMVIAHRLSTIQNADKIIVMHEGRIVETGTHAELLALEGVYHNLVQMQSLA